MGRDLNSAQSAIQKYAQGEAELGFAKKEKKRAYSVELWTMLLNNILKRKNKKD